VFTAPLALVPLAGGPEPVILAMLFAGEGTQMLRDIKDSRHVSFTVDDYTVDWRKVRELQGVGRCRPATEEQAAAWSLHLLKFGRESVRPPGLVYAITRVKCTSWITTTPR
jgi:hypothetical protein